MRLGLRRSCLLMVASLCCVQAQQTVPVAPPDAETMTLHVGTRLVSVAAMVRDKHGRPVSGLKADAFQLKQDGQPVAIAAFSEGSDLPLTLALMVDTSGSQRDFIADETAASKVFFPAMLTRPEDRATLVQFDANVLQLQSMTHSVAKLVSGLDRLADPESSVRGPRRGGTLLYDAICAVGFSVLKKEQGRHAMVLLTDGGDNGSNHSYGQALACALSYDAVVYSVFYSDARDGGGYGRSVLEGLSRGTGGSVFTVSHSHTLEKIYAEIANDMRLQYQIAYRPPPAEPRTYHTLELKTLDKKLKVQARTGYFTPSAVQ